MAPYYTDSAVTIYHGDCREILPSIRDIDLIFTSPPYNVNHSPSGGGRAGSSFYTPSRGGKAHTKWKNFRGYEVHNDAMPHEEYLEFIRDTLTMGWATLTERGAIFLNHKPRIVFKNLWLPLELNPGLPLRQIITWTGCSGIALGDGHFCPAAEWIMIFAKEKYRLVDRSASALSDVWNIPPETDRRHPAPFPIALPARAIRASQCRVIADPFMGSGTTLRAAKDAGKHAIGMDTSERYCEIAAKRMEQEVLPLNLTGNQMEKDPGALAISSLPNGTTADFTADFEF